MGTQRKGSVLLALMLLAVAVPAGAGRASAPQPFPRPELRVGQFEAPLVGARGGKDMPAYVGWTQNTRFPGEAVRTAPHDLVSNIVGIPRSQLGGPGSDEWSPILGVIAGSLSPYPIDETADSFYLWTGVREGQQVVGGNDIGLAKMWFTSFNTAAEPHTPTGRAGSLTWESRPESRRVLHTRTTSYAATSIDDETAVRSPVPSHFTRAMYLNAATLSAQGGDVSAAAGAVPAPAFEFTSPTPPGTVMNLQLVGYTTAGPWSGADVAFDFRTGLTSGPTGTWRIPATVSVKQGGFIPERADLPDTASPQFTIPFTAMGIPLLPEEAGPGANDIHLVADVRPGQSATYQLALRQPDGSTRVRMLELDEPGRHLWSVRDGRLIEMPLPEDGPLLVADEEGSGFDDGESVGTATAPANSAVGMVNAAGRPVLTQVVRGGRAVMDAFDVARLRTPEGELELGAHNRDGRAILTGRAGNVFASAAYRAGPHFVITKSYSSGTWLRSYAYAVSLDGLPHPRSIEADVDPADGTPLLDRYGGEVQAPATLLPSQLNPRLVLPYGEKDMPLGPFAWSNTEVQVRDRAGRDELLDPVAVIRAAGDDVWGFDVTLNYGIPVDPVPAPSGAYTSAKVYRILPAVIDRQVTVGGGPLEETRDLDGSESFAIAFGAKRADGTAIRQTDVTRLYVSLWTADGTELYSGTLARPPWSPDGGTTWGLALTPNGELPPMEIFVYARAVHAGGTVTPEQSPAVSAADWRMRVDRIPVAVQSTTGGVVSGTTAPGASVEVSIPEIDVDGVATADAAGAFSVPLSLGASPGGDYEVLVRATSPFPAEPDRSTAAVAKSTDAVPDDETGTETARLRHLPGGDDPAVHRSEPPADLDAAAAFLRSRESAGAFDGSLRSTSWAVLALDAAGSEPPSASAAYLASLGDGSGSGWRPGEPAVAAASGLAARAARALGSSAPLDLTTLLRSDGTAGAAAARDAASLEGTAEAVLGLQANGELEELDPLWRVLITDRLVEATPGSPAEAFARAWALDALGAPAAASILGADLDAAAYRVLRGSEQATGLAGYQTLGGGFTLRRFGDRPESLPTALALLASA